MSSVTAQTQDITLVVRVASFYPIRSDAAKEIVEGVSNLMADMGKKHGFLVYRTAMEMEQDND